MATPQERLAASLEQLRALQRGGRRVFRSGELSRVHRDRLVESGFLRPVIKGWVISSDPAADERDTTPWYSSFWEFCSRYCQYRFDDRWHLSPEQSLLLNAENTAIPDHLIVKSPEGTNNTIELPFGTSLFDLKQEKMPPDEDMVLRGGLRLLKPEVALIRVPEDFFRRYPVETQVALSGIPDPSDILHRLLEGGHSVIAGRIAGAFRRMGEEASAEEILRTMDAAGYDVRESDPFQADQIPAGLDGTEPPIVRRLRGLWAESRSAVLAVFPEAPGLPDDSDAYLKSVDDVYERDAYHSLSIEGYEVSEELIQRVRSGAWDPDRLAIDRNRRDALAARGYWQAFQRVREAVSAVLSGDEPSDVIQAGYRDWYRELFQPCVAAGLIESSALAGYRSEPVYISGSRHVPPRPAAVRDAMPALLDLLKEEPEPSVRAVLGHWVFGYLHPHPDGSGRMTRFLMNVLLASGGYPWTIVRVEDRSRYLQALETASCDQDIGPLAQLLAERVRSAMEQAT